MWTKSFWKDTTERAVATAAEVALGIFTASAIIEGLDYQHAAITVGVATAAAVLKAIVAQYRNGGTMSPASLVKPDFSDL